MAQVTNKKSPENSTISRHTDCCEEKTSCHLEKSLRDPSFCLKSMEGEPRGLKTSLFNSVSQKFEMLF